MARNHVDWHAFKAFYFVRGKSNKSHISFPPAHIPSVFPFLPRELLSVHLQVCQISILRTIAFMYVLTNSPRTMPHFQNSSCQSAMFSGRPCPAHHFLILYLCTLTKHTKKCGPESLLLKFSLQSHRHANGISRVDSSAHLFSVVTGTRNKCGFHLFSSWSKPDPYPLV